MDFGNTDETGGGADANDNNETEGNPFFEKWIKSKKIYSHKNDKE